MNSINRLSSLAISRRASQITRIPLRRTYATGYDDRTQQTLRTSSRLTWLITSVAAVAAGAYFYNNNSSTPVSEKVKHAKHSDLESAKPVEDRHGDSVAKHSIAAKKNENKVRTGVFREGTFDNHLQEHTRDPSKDFEETKKK